MISGWLIPSLLLSAAVGGLVGNWLLRRRRTARDDSFGIKDLIAPVTTLAVVLMAFVLAQSAASYGRASENGSTEAQLVDEMSACALRLDDRAAAVRMQQNLACCARAAHHREWGPMDLGERAAEASRWVDGLEDELAALKSTGGDDAEVGRLIDLDSQRADVRVARINESSHTNPMTLSWMMLGTVVASVVGLGLFVTIKESPAIGVVLMATLSAVLAVTLYMIDDLDQPFRGSNTLRPIELRRAQERVDERLFAVAAEVEVEPSVPCDDGGAAG